MCERKIASKQSMVHLENGQQLSAWKILTLDSVRKKGKPTQDLSLPFVFILNFIFKIIGQARLSLKSVAILKSRANGDLSSMFCQIDNIPPNEHCTTALSYNYALYCMVRGFQEIGGSTKETHLEKNNHEISLKSIMFYLISSWASYSLIQLTWFYY